MEERIWVDVNSANDWVNELLGHELHQTKIDSLTKQNVYSIKLSVEYDAASLRRSYVFDPTMGGVERFDLYKSKGIRIVVMVQYGEVISVYLELM